MAKRRTKAEKEVALAAAAAVEAIRNADEDAGPVADGEPGEELIEDILLGLQRMEGAQTARWEIYCEDHIDGEARTGFVDKLKSDQLDPVRFKTRYGPGSYVVQGRTPDGKYIKGSRAHLKVADTGEWEASKKKADGANPHSILETLNEQRAAERRERMESLKEWAAILTPVAAPMLAGMFNRKPDIDVMQLATLLRPQQSNITELTTAMAQLRALQPESSDKLDIVFKLMERFSEMPSSGGGAGWMDILRDVVKDATPVVGGLLQNLANRVPAAPGAPPAPVRVGPAPPPAALAPPVQPSQPVATVATPGAVNGAPVNPEPTMFQLAEPWLRKQADNLLEWASQNIEPSLCADMLYASVPKMFRAVVSAEQLRAWLADPQWWQFLSTFAPPLAPYQAWCDNVREELLGIVEEELEAKAAPPGDAPPSQPKTVQ